MWWFLLLILPARCRCFFILRVLMIDWFLVKFVTLLSELYNNRDMHNPQYNVNAFKSLWHKLVHQLYFTWCPADDHVTSPSFIGLIQILGTPSRILSALEDFEAMKTVLVGPQQDKSLSFWSSYGAMIREGHFYLVPKIMATHDKS